MKKNKKRRASLISTFFFIYSKAEIYRIELEKKKGRWEDDSWNYFWLLERKRARKNNNYNKMNNKKKRT